MKILLIGNYYYPEHVGGVEIVSHNLVKHYRRMGQDVRWIASDVPPHFRTRQPDDAPIRSWNVAEEKLGFPSPIPFPQDLGKLYSNIRWCDIVHLQDCLYPINILAFLMLKVFKKPVLITQYAKMIPYSQWYKRALQSLLYFTIGRLMAHHADRLVFITENVRQGMIQILAAPHCGVIPLGVDTDFFMPLDEQERLDLRSTIFQNPGGPVLLFVGRMVERKGVGLIHELIDRHPQWKWILVGRADDFDPSAWSSPNLVYFPKVDEQQLRRFYSAADLLIHPSRGEGFTLTASESIACGTPVVISRESLYEIEPANAGLFLAIEPKIDEVERTIVEALSQPEWLGELSQRVRQYAVSRFSWKAVAQQYLAVLRELVQEQAA